MPYALRYREELPESVKRELDDMVAFYNRMFGVAFNEDGTLKASALVIPQGSVVLEEEHWWRNGPWTFDDPSAGDPHVAGLRPPDIPGGTYNDYAPAGIENAIIVEVDPVTSDVTLTGIKAPSPMRKRMILFRNRDSALSVFLNHANTGSQPQNRFSLPGSVDIELGPLQNVWLYYDLGLAAWTAAITTQASGGLNEGGAGGGDVVGPASAVDSNFAAFDTTTGKLIKDGGFSSASFALAGAGGGILSSVTDFSEAQIITMSNTTPRALTPDPVSATGILCPISWTVETEKTGARQGNGANLWELIHNTSGFLGFGILTQANTDITAATDRATVTVGNNSGVRSYSGYSLRDPRGKALAAAGTTAITSFSGTGVCTVRVTVLYYEVASIGTV